MTRRKNTIQARQRKALLIKNNRTGRRLHTGTYKEILLWSVSRSPPKLSSGGNGLPSTRSVACCARGIEARHLRRRPSDDRPLPAARRRALDRQRELRKIPGGGFQLHS